MVLLISERFTARKCHSWQSGNRPPAGRHSPYLNVLQFENRIPEHQQIDHLAGRNYPHLNVSKSQYVIPDIIRLFHLIWTFRRQKMPFLTISSSAQSTSERLAVWKQNSWISAVRQYSRKKLLIFESFEVRKRDSWASANRTSCRMVLLLSEHFPAWKNIPDNPQIDPVVDRHSKYMIVFQA